MPGEESDTEFDDLLLMVKETRGFDFTGYKRSTLTRRIRRRMDAVRVATLSEYRDYLELDTLDRLARSRPRDAERLRERAAHARRFAARERARAATYRSDAHYP